MSLYLKYRPRSFADVIGQEHIVTTLEHAVNRDQLVHAYLFFGPRGTGKTSVARILAKILLIRGISDETLQKQIVKSVDEGTLIDLIEIDAATNRQIDDVRDLKEKVQFSPSVASAKVYIIDEVHMMTKEAFNALLKTLEEPPEHIYFILATTELHKVPDTIQSRCQRFPFLELPEEDIVRGLQNIADKERIKIDRAALRAIARHVQGSMRDAISLLDQLSALEAITEEEVRLRIGESTEEYVEKLWSAIEAHDRAAVLEIIASLGERGVSLEVFLRQLLARARQELHECIAASGDIALTTMKIDAIFQALRDLRVSPVPSVAIEVALVALCEGEGKRSFTKVFEGRKQKKAKQQEEEEDVGAQDTSREQGGTPPATFLAEHVTLETVREAWPTILSSIPSASLRMSLKDASLHSLTDGLLTLIFSSSFHREKAAHPKASHELAKVLEGHFRTPLRIEYTLREAEVPVGVGVNGEEAVNLAEAVAEIFGK